jgi:hypothetical protein
MSENYGIYPICMECGDSISNPVCHECLKEQMFAYLADKIVNGKIGKSEYLRMRKTIARLNTKLWSYRDTGISCIKCSESLAICPHCYVRHVKGILTSFDCAFSSFSFCFNFV